MKWEVVMTDSQSASAQSGGIVNLSSDEEVANVGTPKTARKLADGDEYIDLEELDGEHGGPSQRLLVWGADYQEWPCTKIPRQMF